MNSDFQEKLASFLASCARITNESRLRRCPNQTPDAFIVDPGAEFIRIVRKPAGGGQFAHCFVGMDGSVYRASNWSGRCKKPYGNIFDGHNGTGQISEYGVTRVRNPSLTHLSKISA